MKILVAEDNEDSRILLEHALAARGHAVEAATNGVDALELALQSRPDMVISDIQMPRMDGFDLCRLIKSAEHLSEIPFVFYSATYIDPEHRQFALSLGASRFIVKPMEIQDFLEVIDELFKEYYRHGLPIPDRIDTTEEELKSTHTRILTDKLAKKVQQLEERNAALQASEKRYRDTVEVSSDWVWETDAESRFTYASERFSEISGVEREHLYGQPGEQIVNSLGIEFMAGPKEKEAYLAALKEHRPFRNIPYQRAMPDGSFRYVEISGKPIFEEDSTFQGFRGTGTDVTKRRRAEKQLRRLSSEISLAEEKERRRIAAELHDGTVQNLGLTKIKLGALQASVSSQERHRLIDEIRDLVEYSIRDTRSLIFELSPPVLYELGLEAAVEWLAERFQVQHDIACEVITDTPTKPLSLELEVVLFQVVRELLINVIKHAAASRVTITVRRFRDKLQLTVEDDGAGFGPGAIGGDESENKGFGLFSIRERLALLNATLKIESHCGTRMTVTAPLIADQGEVA